MYWSCFFSHFISSSSSLYSISFLRSAMRHTSHINVKHCLVSISVRARLLALHLHIRKFSVSFSILFLSSSLRLQMENKMWTICKKTFSSNTIRSISVYNWHFPFALFLCVSRSAVCATKIIRTANTSVVVPVHWSWLFLVEFVSLSPRFLLVVIAKCLLFLIWWHRKIYSKSFLLSISYFCRFVNDDDCVSLTGTPYFHNTLSTFQCQFFCLDYLHKWPRNWSTRHRIFVLFFEWKRI